MSEYCLRSSKRRVVIARSPRFRKAAGVPLKRRRRPGCHLSPPKRLVGLVGDIAPGDADVVQLPIGPTRQLPAGLVALPPDMEGLSQLAEKARYMMIYHRFMGVSGHLRLL